MKTVFTRSSRIRLYVAYLVIGVAVGALGIWTAVVSISSAPLLQVLSFLLFVPAAAYLAMGICRLVEMMWWRKQRRAEGYWIGSLD